MADINAYLREAINGPAPQHKVAGRDQFEITEGSDGATHTKIVGADGEPLDKIPVEVVNAGEPTVFPEDYPDSAVRAVLAEIKVAQAEILERLDGTIDTRVTGSNDELDVNVKNYPDVEFPSDYPDVSASERLEAIEQTQAGIITTLQVTNDHLNSVIKDDRLQADTVSDGRFVSESTDDKPVGKEGDTLFLWDTRQVFLHDGTEWRPV